MEISKEKYLKIVQEAKQLFQDIPEEQWIVKGWTDNVNACCALGHWKRLHNIDPKNYDKSMVRLDPVLSELEVTTRHYLAFRGFYQGMISVNDGYVNIYQQETPKQRVMAVINDMIKHFSS